MVRHRVQTRLERKRTGPEEWLVVTRRPLTDNGIWESRASRDATEQDERYRGLDHRAGHSMPFESTPWLAEAD